VSWPCFTPESFGSNAHRVGDQKWPAPLHLTSIKPMPLLLMKQVKPVYLVGYLPCYSGVKLEVCSFVLFCFLFGKGGMGVRWVRQKNGNRTDLRTELLFLFYAHRLRWVTEPTRFCWLVVTIGFKKLLCSGQVHRHDWNKKVSTYNKEGREASKPYPRLTMFKTSTDWFLLWFASPHRFWMCAC